MFPLYSRPSSLIRWSRGGWGVWKTQKNSLDSTGSCTRGLNRQLKLNVKGTWINTAPKSSGLARVVKGSHRFACRFRVYPYMEWNIPVFASSADPGWMEDWVGLRSSSTPKMSLCRAWTDSMQSLSNICLSEPDAVCKNSELITAAFKFSVFFSVYERNNVVFIRLLMHLLSCYFTKCSLLFTTALLFRVI